MIKYFNIIKDVSRDEFIKKFQAHEKQRENEYGRDGFAQDRVIKGLELDSSLTYYKCKLRDEGLKNLVLPYHIHDTNLVSSGGKLLDVIMSEFDTNTEQNTDKECIKKIECIKKERFPSHLKAWDAKFIFLSNDNELSHPNGEGVEHYHSNYPKESIFIGNGFHRLIAYKLSLIEIDRFIPIEIYYGHN